MSRPDVVIVGAGVIGCATAWELVKRGLRVTVVEKGRPGCESSNAAAGMLAPETAEGREEPYAMLARMSRDLYAPLANELREASGVDIERQTNGHLHLLVNEHEFTPGHLPEGAELLSAQDVHRLEPAVGREIHGALLFRGNHWVNNERLVAALVQAASGRGVEFRLGSEVTEITREGSRATGVRGRNLSVQAGSVVVAAGAWCGTLGGLIPPLIVEPVKGQMLSVEAVPAIIRHCVFREEVYLVPRPSGELLIGATVERVGYDKQVTPAGLHTLLTHALAAVPAIGQRPILRSWAGLRPATADLLPVLGPWPGLEGCFVATAHLRNGILLAPITAQLMAEWITGKGPTLPVESFLPDRFV